MRILTSKAEMLLGHENQIAAYVYLSDLYSRSTTHYSVFFFQGKDT